MSIERAGSPRLVHTVTKLKLNIERVSVDRYAHKIMNSIGLCIRIIPQAVEGDGITLFFFLNSFRAEYIHC